MTISDRYNERYGKQFYHDDVSASTRTQFYVVDCDWQWCCDNKKPNQVLHQMPRKAGPLVNFNVWRLRDDMPQSVGKPGDVVPGDVFEDCRYHPCLCYDVGDPGDEEAVFGISLVDGSTWQCSIVKCGIRKLTPAEVWLWKSEGPPDVELSPENRWWT